MERSWRNIVIALAGMTQELAQVERLAKTGYLESEVFETAVKSLFVQNPPSTETVFNNISHIQRGLDLLKQILNDHRAQSHADLLRYAVGVTHIQKRLSKRSDVLYVIGNRLEKAESQVAHFGPTHDNVISSIADIYSDTISKFPYRIQVMGEYTYLQQTRVANQIRVLLLAAVRAATLWRQVGGSRWHFLFYRKHLIREAEALLNESRQLS